MKHLKETEEKMNAYRDAKDHGVSWLDVECNCNKNRVVKLTLPFSDSRCLVLEGLTIQVNIFLSPQRNYSAISNFP